MVRASGLERDARAFLIVDQQTRIHCITGTAVNAQSHRPRLWEFESPVPGSLESTFLGKR